VADEDIVFRLDVIEQANGAVYVSCGSREGGEASGELPQPVVSRLESQLATLEQSVLLSGSRPVTRGTPGALERPVREFGTTLYDAVLRAGVGVAFQRARGVANHDRRRLRLELKVKSARLARLPWEFLFDPIEEDYLALTVPVSRYPEVMEPVAPLAVTPPLRILGVVTSPTDRPPLDTERERANLRRAIEPLGADRVQLTWLDGDDADSLRRAIRTGPWHILHFVGHGGFDEDANEGYLEMVGEGGRSDPILAGALGRLLRENSSLRLVVLNACESGRTGGANVFSGAAPALMRRGIPAVVAMQYEISDPVAITFASALYNALADNASLDWAVTDARSVVKERHRGSLEWGTPVLYLRSQGTRIFDVAPSQSSEPAAERRPIAPHVEPAPAAPPAAPHLEPARAESPRSSEPAAAAARAVPAQTTPAPKPTTDPRPPGTPPAATPAAATPPAATTPPAAGTVQYRSGVQQAPAEPAPAKYRDRQAQDRHTRDRQAPARPAGGISETPPHGVPAPPAPGAATATGAIERCRLSHPSPVLAVAFDDSRSALATASQDGTVLLWDLATAEVIRSLRVPGAAAGAARRLALVRGGRYLAVAYGDGTARVWDTDTEVVMLAIRPAGVREVWSVAFSPDGGTVAIGCSDQVAVLVDHHGRELARLTHQPVRRGGGQAPLPRDVATVAFSPDGRWLATGSTDGNARIWSTAGSVSTTLPHPEAVSDLAFTPNGNHLLTGAADGNARIWTPAGQITARLRHSAPVTSVACGPDGRRVATASIDGAVGLWTVDGRRVVSVRHGTAAYGVACAADGRRIATATGDKVARVWELDERRGSSGGGGGR
jgi:CHAT domain/WD domain, G-beta repeat